MAFATLMTPVLASLTFSAFATVTVSSMSTETSSATTSTIALMYKRATTTIQQTVIACTWILVVCVVDLVTSTSVDALTSPQVTAIVMATNSTSVTCAGVMAPPALVALTNWHAILTAMPPSAMILANTLTSVASAVVLALWAAPIQMLATLTTTLTATTILACMTTYVETAEAMPTTVAQTTWPATTIKAQDVTMALASIWTSAATAEVLTP